MKKKKLTMSLILAGTMFAGCLAGCGNNPAGTSEGSSDSGNSGANQQQAQESEQGSEEETSQGEAPSGEVVDIKWVAVGSGMPTNYDAWKANLDAYLEEKIGVHLDMEVVSWADWGNRRSVIVNSNEDYDILFTDSGSYLSDVRMGAFADISSLVKSASPNLYSLIPEDYWNAVSIDGKIYAVPTYKDSSATQYFVWDQNLAESYEIDYENIHDLQSLTEPFTKLLEGEGSAPFILSSDGVGAVLDKYDGLGIGLPAIGVSYNDSSKTVVPVLEQDDIMADLRTLREWYTKGIINADANTLGEVPTYRMCYVAQGWPLAAKTTWGPNMGVEAVAIQWGDTHLSYGTVGGSMSCISASSKNPEKALQFLELVNTDTFVRDALYYGLEGDNFDYTDDGRVHKNNSDWTMAGYTQGTFFNVSLTDDVEENQWDEVRALNEEAVPSPVLGISIDTSEFEDELANCTEIFKRYRPDLLTGATDPDVDVPRLMAELRENGLDTIIEKVQAQIDAAK